MDLIVIGAGPAYTDRRGAAAASFLVRAQGAALLLDLGQGAFPNLASTMEPSELAAVVVSHLHPDHFIDLVPLRHYLKWQFEPPRRVSVVAPEGLTDRLDALHANPGFTDASLDVSRLTEGTRRIGPFEITARLVTHTEDSYALRVSVASEPAAPGLVYSGDCGRAADLVPLIRPGDTLLAEASFGAESVPPGASHLTTADAARAASEGRAARLLITHVLMGLDRGKALDAARAAFPGQVRLVTEGDRFTV
jgi:ribonuclease BN (tRNA processing enzyme)